MTVQIKSVHLSRKLERCQGRFGACNEQDVIACNFKSNSVFILIQKSCYLESIIDIQKETPGKISRGGYL